LLPEGNPLIDPVRAYWSALRGMMRIEMEEGARRAASDELSVLGSSDVTDEEFEREFRRFIGRNLLVGALLPVPEPEPEPEPEPQPQTLKPNPNPIPNPKLNYP